MNDDKGVGVCDPMHLVPLPVDSSLAPDVDLITVTSQLQTHTAMRVVSCVLHGLPFVVSIRIHVHVTLVVPSKICRAVGFRLSCC